jgi:hypothetical protein
VAHLAEEVCGLLAEAAAVCPTKPVTDEDAAPLAALAVRPRDLASLGSDLGFVQHGDGFESGSWGMPRADSPEDLARLLLANPHVELMQVAERLSEREAEDVCETLVADLHLDEQTCDVYLRVPVKVAAALLTRSEPGTLHFASTSTYAAGSRPWTSTFSSRQKP